MMFLKHSSTALVLLYMLMFAACRKTEYPSVAQPAYIRVFNDLQYRQSLDNKDIPQPFLTFLMDPQLDASGVPSGAVTTGDFLDMRDAWARPYPDAGNTSIWQKEYPGSAKVIAAPILNGFDLSPWAQVSSGKRRIMVLTRPRNNTRFFDLQPSLRRDVLLDTTIELKAGEVYTLHILQQNAVSLKTGLYVREETFWKQSFSDSLVYTNFYNLSAEGFFAQTRRDPAFANYPSIRDTMQVFYTLMKITNTEDPGNPDLAEKLRAHNGVFMTRIVRSQEPVVQPYYSFPLFADTSANRIFTGNMVQLFTFLTPGYTPNNHPFFTYDQSDGNFATLYCGSIRDAFGAYRITADLRTGLIISVHSGRHNPRSFATVNTVEYVNGQMYITSIQRRYDPPIYN